LPILDEIRAKYAKTEKVVDKYGRIITVRLLTVSQRTDIRKWAGTDDATVQAPMMFAASVCAINDLPYTFPKSEAELKAVMDMLDDDGMLSIAQTYQKLVPDTTEEQDIEAAKNLPATAS
jgi:hypothetical protein